MATERFYPATKQQAATIIEKLSHVLQPVEAPEYARKTINATDGTITLTVKDPANASVGNVVVARWVKTVIVKNADHTPENPYDGVTVVEWSERDKYHRSGYVDAETNQNMHYRAFAFAENGEYSASTEFHTFDILGFYIDTTDANESTCVHYTDSNADFERAGMDFDTGVFNYGGWEGSWLFDMFTPCMMRSDGSIYKKLDRNNYNFYDDGTPSDIANQNFDGNAMMAVKPIYVKLVEQDSKQYAKFAPEKIDDDWECWSAKLWVDEHDRHLYPHGKYAEYFGLPLFEGSVINNKLRSLATGAKPTSNTTQPQEIQYASGNGDHWYTTLWADEMLMRLLGVLVFGRLDSQKALGGCYVPGASALALNCGSMADKPMFWGANMLDSSGNAKETLTGTKFFGMENWWAHRNRRSCGLNFINGQYRIKLTPSEIDGSAVTGFNGGTTAADYAGYIPCGSFSTGYPSSSPIKRMNWGQKDCMTPAAAGGSLATYYCDNCYTANGVLGFFSGGHCGNGLIAGLFYSNLYYSHSISYWHLGSSPSYHPF